MVYEKFIYGLRHLWRSPVDESGRLKVFHPEDQFNPPLIWDGLKNPDLPVHVEVFSVRGPVPDSALYTGFEVKDEERRRFYLERFMKVSPSPAYVAEDGRVVWHHRPMYHPHNELILYAGLDPDNPSDLGADISHYLGLGDRSERHDFNRSTLLWVPPGFVHGPDRIANFRKPFKLLVIVPDYPTVVEHGVLEHPPDYKPFLAEPREYVDIKRTRLVGPKPVDPLTFPKGRLREASPTGRRFAYSVDRAWFSPIDESGKLRNFHQEDQLNPPLIWDGLSIPEFPFHVEVYLVRGDGTDFYPNMGFEVRDKDMRLFFEKLMKVSPGPVFRAEDGRIIWSRRPMYHPHNEFTFFVGTDSYNPTDLGGEVHLWLGLGDRSERHIIREPSFVWIPRGLVHGPVLFRNMRKPLMWVSVVPDSAYRIEHSVNEWPPEYEPYPKQPREYVDLTKTRLVGPKPSDLEIFPAYW
ncbi:MAG: hypothetical protein QW717_07525 [Candidatus Bathyarchaeia archaeon]